MDLGTARQHTHTHWWDLAGPEPTVVEHTHEMGDLRHHHREAHGPQVTMSAANAFGLAAEAIKAGDYDKARAWQSLGETIARVPDRWEHP